MERVRLQKRVRINELPFPSPYIELDNINRVIILRYTHKSIIVQYDTVWQGQTNFLDTYTQTITDKTV